MENDKQINKKYVRPLPKFLSKEEVQLIRDQTKNMHDRMLVDLLYYFGLRVSELCALQREWFDFKEEMLELPREAVKRKRSRRIPISKIIKSDLKKYLDSLLEGEQIVKVTRQTVYNRLKQWAKEAGLTKNVHPHMLRHTYATAIYNAKRDLNLVKELLGHENISTTAIYARCDDKYMKEGIEGVL